MKARTHASPRGYSLVELIVAVGIFSMVMLVVTGVYLVLISYDRQARANNALVSNLSFAVESMMRNIRTGTGYPTGCVSGCSSLQFTNSENVSITYRLGSNGTIEQHDGGVWVPLTDPNIEVQTLSFYVRGVTPGDIIQPQVTAVVHGVMDTNAGESLEFTIQTSGTQRVLDI